MARFLGRLIDWVLLFIVSFIIGAIYVAIAVADAVGGGGMMSNGVFGSGFSIVGILVSLIPGAYFIGMLAFNDGRTVGKMLVGLQVRSAAGTPLDVSQAFRREWWNLLLVIPFFLGNLATAGMAIFIAVSINNGQPWHDQQAGTYELKTK